MLSLSFSLASFNLINLCAFSFKFAITQKEVFYKSNEEIFEPKEKIFDNN